MRKIIKTTVVLAVLVIACGNVSAQQPNNPLLYGNQATLFGKQGPAGDPASLIMPGTAYKSGFGSFIDNPASMALHKESFGEFGLSFRSIEEDAVYRGQSRLLDDDQGGVANLGFLYSFPTVQGSFVFGAGYTQHTIYNRALGLRAHNDNSTITDEFKADGSPYQTIAFETYAIDFLDIPEECEWNGDQFTGIGCESIFRIGFDNYGDYLGIRQQSEIFQRGSSGEYSMFFATEFQENLMVGASIGLRSGTFRYSRIFQEIDEDNEYNSTIIDLDGDGTGDTDIDNILLDDRIRSRFNGFSARAGFIYRISDKINIGGSYSFPVSLEVNEIFDAEIRTTFDNSTEFSDATDSEFTYRVKYPGRLALGLGLAGFSGFSASFSAEYTDYSKTSVEFDGSEFFEDELAENDFIRDTYDAVWSFRAGLAYDFSPDFTIRAGYGYEPSRFLGGEDHQTSYSLGAGLSLTKNIRLDIAAHYTEWEDVTSVYDYARYDYSPLPDELPAVSFRSEEAVRSAERVQLLGTLRIGF